MDAQTLAYETEGWSIHSVLGLLFWGGLLALGGLFWFGVVTEPIFTFKIYGCILVAEVIVLKVVFHFWPNNRE